MTFEKWYEDNVKYITTFDFKAWLQEAWDAGLIAEREACAKVCEETDLDWRGLGSRIDCAAAIRARGEKQW